MWGLYTPARRALYTNQELYYPVVIQVYEVTHARLYLPHSVNIANYGIEVRSVDLCRKPLGYLTGYN